MLRNSLIIFLILFGLSSVSAGGFDKRKLGVEASWTWNAGGFEKNDATDDIFACGGNLGLCYKLVNRHGWFFEPTISFSYGSYHFFGNGKQYDTSLTAIELPIKFGHDFKLPVLDMTVSPLIAIKPVMALGGHLAVDDADYHWNRFNIAGCFGFGLLVDDKFGVSIRSDINLFKSICNLPKSTGISNHNGLVNITLKYYF